MPARHGPRRGKYCEPHRHHRGHARTTSRLLLLPLLLEAPLLKFSTPHLLLQLRLLLRILLFLRVPALLHLFLLLLLLRVRHHRFHQA
jgi:hypothetical protein